MRDVATAQARVVIAEDQEPRVGELPHPRGYLLLEDDEIRALVDGDVQAARVTHGKRSLTAFELPVGLLTAVDMVRKRSLQQIRQLRRKRANDARSGRRHAFFAMLHLNATLALEVYASTSDAPKRRGKRRRAGEQFT